VIQKFIESIEKTIHNSPIILSSSTQKQVGPNSETVYLKSNLLFIDSSILEITSFPHHKHTPIKIIQSPMPSLKDVLNEISAIIILE